MHKKGIYEKYLKRPIDIFISFTLIVIISPVFVLTTLLILISSRGGLLFKQLRPGKKMNLFTVYKFRTMVQGAENSQIIGKEVFSDDSRITFVGKILRRLKIDELPQLFNILKGDMSLVGPRPTLPEYIQMYEDWEKVRFDVKPGITGLAQVNGNIHLTRIQKSVLDKKYVDNITFIGDIIIILKTFFVIIFGESKFIKRNNRGD